MAVHRPNDDLEADDVKGEMMRFRAELKEREGRGRRNKVTPRLEESLRAEREDENSQPLPLKSCRKQRPAPQKKQSTNASDTATAAISPGASAGTLPPDAEDDTEDTDFVYVDSDEGPDPPALLTCSDSDDKEDNDNNDNNEDFFNISPEETADILPSKSLPDASVKVNARLRQATITQPADKRTRPSADPDIKVSASTTATTAAIKVNALISSLQH
ncbi:hypothetical protein HGRIS_001095 [Hohenbuehelia grisea]|uniref:Uncharacterized protein n=1 Tax=Hohenbuehelia grisea TaxID=104357 RepID=A0ABR3JQF7_9AGAR